MSYEVEYRAIFTDIEVLDWKIDILSEDYAGSVKVMALAGSAPLSFDFLSPTDRLLESPIKGSFVSFNVLSRTDFQYANLYSVGDFQYKVNVYHSKSGGAAVLYWSGWIVSGNYSEPYDDATYIVNIAANDSLGVLKNIPFDNNGAAYNGRMLLSEILLTIFAKINVTQFKEFISIYEADMGNPPAAGDSPLDQTMVDLDLFYEMDCYEVLEHILKMFNCIIKQKAGVMMIYDPVDYINENTLYGRLFTAPTTKSETTIYGPQSISRVGAVTDLRSVNGGMMLIDPPVKKLTIFQDYGSKESWIDNYEFDADTYKNADFDFWTQVNGTYARPLSDYVAKEDKGVAIIGSLLSPIYNLRQEFAEYAKESSGDTFYLEFEWGFWNKTAGTIDDTQLLLSITMDTSPVQSLRHKSNMIGLTDNTSELEWGTIDNNKLINFWRDVPSGWSGWNKFERKFVGIPADGAITVNLFATNWPTNVYACFRNIKLYLTSEEIVKMPSAWYSRGRLSTQGQTYNKMRFPAGIILRTEKKTEFTNPITFGLDVEEDRILGDVLNAGADNILEQFQGSIATKIGTAVNPSDVWKPYWRDQGSIIDVTGRELCNQYSRPKQMITMPILDKGATAPAINIVGFISDSLNTFNEEVRKFAINSARFDAKEREWSVDMVELITPPEIVPEELDGGLDNLVATAINNNRIDLEWDDTASNEEGFEIWRSVDDDTYELIKTTLPNVVGYSDIGLTEDTLYNYKVRAFLGTDYSDFESDSATTTDTPGSIAVDLEALYFESVSNTDCGGVAITVTADVAWYIEATGDTDAFSINKTSGLGDDVIGCEYIGPMYASKIATYTFHFAPYIGESSGITFQLRAAEFCE